MRLTWKPGNHQAFEPSPGAVILGEGLGLRCGLQWRGRGRPNPSRAGVLSRNLQLFDDDESAAGGGHRERGCIARACETKC
jgi:hypothetical protein